MTLNLNTKATGKPVTMATVQADVIRSGATSWELENGLRVNVRQTRWTACIGSYLVEVVAPGDWQGSKVVQAAGNDADLEYAINEAYRELDTTREAVKRARRYC